MEFKIIPLKILCTNLNDFLMNHYSHGFEQLKNFIFFDISLERFNRIKSGEPFTEKEILGIVSHMEVSNIRNKTEILNKVWHEKEKDIFEAIKLRTGIMMFAESMICYLDPYTRLGFYSEGKSITISSQLPLKDSLMVIAHEIFHIFYWKKVAEMRLFEKKNPKHGEWELSEATVYFLLKEKEFNKFWPGVRINLYPNIRDIYKKVKDFWAEGDFNNYILKSYGILNENG